MLLGSPHTRLWIRAAQQTPVLAQNHSPTLHPAHKKLQAKIYQETFALVPVPDYSHALYTGDCQNPHSCAEV